MLYCRTVSNGSAVGFTLAGGNVLAVTAPFITMRAFEMIRYSMGYMNTPLKVAGLASGVAFGQLGYTHCSIEDINHKFWLTSIYSGGSYQSLCLTY